MSRTFRRLDSFVENISVHFIHPIPKAHVYRDVKWIRKLINKKKMKANFREKMRTERRIKSSLLKKDYEIWDELVYKKEKTMYFDICYNTW